ncbi:665_t:CDS:2, partial [Funneliformis caledonium]
MLVVKRQHPNELQNSNLIQKQRCLKQVAMTLKEIVFFFEKNDTVFIVMRRKKTREKHYSKAFAITSEVNIRYMYNHVINSAELLSFRRVNEEVREELLNLFKDDRSINPDYDYTTKLFQEYRKATLRSCNGESMFERLAEVIKNYNDSDQGKVILQAYDARIGKAFILYIVTNLMSRVHEKVPQAGKLYYVNASASFEPLNTLITLLYTSCAVGALPFRLFIMLDELEVTLERAMIQVWREMPWSYVTKRDLPFIKEDRASIMVKMKKIIYAASSVEMDTCYYEFKQEFYHTYPQLQKHFELLWKRQNFWALSYHIGLPIRGNNTNNYVERSFGILKDIVFARTQVIYVLRNGSYVPVRNKLIQMKFKRQMISGVLCKHQGAVSVKFGISTFNYIPSLTLDDHILYTYIALGYVAKDRSFYASLHARPTSQNQILHAKIGTLDNNLIIDW